MKLDTTTRGLTLRQPWADAVVLSNKRVENRGWRPSTSPPITLLIHAADRAPEQIGQPATLPGTRRAVLAVAVFAGAHAGHGCTCSTWAEPDAPWHWELSTVTPLRDPVPTPGGRGLWRPSAGLLARVEKAGW